MLARISKRDGWARRRQGSLWNSSQPTGRKGRIVPAAMATSLHINDPRAWRAATLDAPAAWHTPLPASVHAALDTIGTVPSEPGRLAGVRLARPLRAALARDLEPLRRELETGRGFAILDGPDPAACSDARATALYWMVGLGLGRPFEQNVQGTVLYDVRDTGQSVSQGARFSVTNAESSFHTDNSFGDRVLDDVGLLCLRTARAGGLSRVVSGYAVRAILQAEHPDALDVLSRLFHVDRRGGTRAGETPTAQVPVIEERAGEVLYRYLRYWIEAGHARAGEPLTAAQAAALDLLDAVLSRPELRAEFDLRPGQMFFINNRWILHNRTAFEDHQEPERRRHLVRLWLAAT